MPLTVPSGGGLARNQFLFVQQLFSDGADTAINFDSCSFDYNNGVFLIGGNNSFTGKMTGGRNGKIIQDAALPSTAIGAGDIQRIRPSDIDNGTLVKTNNEFARSSDGGATWVDITPAAVVTYTEIWSWFGQIVCMAGNGSEDLYISTDNGATYPNTRDIFSAAAAVADRTEDGGLLVVGCDNAQVFSTADEDLTTATIIAIDLAASIGASGNIVCLAIKPTGDEIVLGLATGDIVVSIDSGVSYQLFDRDNNFFRNGAGAGDVPQSVTYVEALNGFIVQANLVSAFIPTGGALDTMQPVINISTFPAGGEAASASDGTDLVIVGGTNNTLRLARLA